MGTCPQAIGPNRGEEGERVSVLVEGAQDGGSKVSIESVHVSDP